MFLFEKVAILGAGLLGGSLAFALKTRGLCSKVSAWSRSEASRNACKSSAWCDFVSETVEGAVDDADLIVISCPSDYIPSLAESAVGFAKEGALFTDLGSTKAGVARKCRAIFKDKNVFFVPSHPMAGSEKSGAQNADANLFEGAPCFVCPTENATADEKIIGMWNKLGMRVFKKTPEEHDEIVAAVSHIPQCAASGLSFFASRNEDMFKDFSGKGFKDTTRIAKSDPAMWLSIFKENAGNIERGLREYARIIENLADQIRAGDEASLESFLKTARAARENLDK